MACDGYTEIFDLSAREMLKLDGARGTTLRVTRGTVWITMQDDTRDVVLRAGDAFTIDRGGLTIVEAQGAATLCALARHVSATRVRPGANVPSWTARLAAARRWAPWKTSGVPRG